MQHQVAIDNTLPTNDAALVVAYREACATYGCSSQEAGKAFEPIFKRYWPQLCKWAVGKIGGTYFAEEIAAETMKTVLKRLNSDEAITDLRPVVRQCLKRDLSDALERLYQGKRMQRHFGAEEMVVIPVLSLNQMVGQQQATAPFGEDLELIDLIEDPSESIEDLILQREQIEELQALIKKMPANYRNSWVQKRWHGWSAKKVAQQLSLTVHQVEHHSSRGGQWLAQRLANESPDWLLAS